MALMLIHLESGNACCPFFLLQFAMSPRRAEQEPMPPSPGLGLPGRCAGAAAPPLSPSLRGCRPAPMRVVADEHCLPQEGECFRSTTYSDCLCCLLAGLSKSGCLRGWACRVAASGQLPRSPRPSSAAAAPLRCGWSSTSIAGLSKGSLPVDHAPDCRRRLFSFGRPELGPLSRRCPGRLRRATTTQLQLCSAPGGRQ